MIGEILTVIGVVIGALLFAFVLYLAIPFRRPFATESDYSHHRSPWWEINYGHKYLWPRTLAERGSGLEAYFASRRFEPAAAELADAREISLRAVGDLMVRPELLGEAGAGLWDEVGEVVFGGDLAMGNLEFSLNEDWFILKTIRYAVPATWAAPLLGDARFGRFDYVSLGNNHINDSLSAGIRRTCEHLDELGVLHSGANRSPEEQDAFPIVKVSGVKIALLAYTFSTNGVPLDAASTPHGVNVVRFNAFRDVDYDDSLIRRHAALARERGADFVVSTHHWCCDHEVYPPARVVPRAHALFEAGVDLIIGHHPHIIGPVDVHEARDGRRCLAYWSLGSLTTYALPFAHQRLSLIAETVLEAGRGPDGRTVVRPKRVVLTPAFHSTRKVGGALRHRVLAIGAGLARLRAGGGLPPGWTQADARAAARLQAFAAKVVGNEGIELR